MDEKIKSDIIEFYITPISEAQMSQSEEKKHRVILVDGSAIIKSCFEGYKNPNSSTYKGRAIDTAALLGYMTRVKKIYESFEFDEIIHVIDPPGGSNYRYGLYPAYKGTRKPSNPVLVAQEHMLLETLAAFGERCIRMRGVESDDVLATLAERMKKENKEVLIISPDKDLLQLVENESVYIARYVNDPGRPGYKTWALYDEDAVFKEFGVSPDQVADYLALIGDSSDNIIGVPSMGPKSAAKWLNEFGNLSNLMANSDKVPGKLGENLRSCEQIDLWSKLTQALRHVENVVVPDSPEINDEKLKEACEWILWPKDNPIHFSKEIHGKGLPYDPNARRPKKPIDEIDQLLQEAESLELEIPAEDPFAGADPFANTQENSSENHEDLDALRLHDQEFEPQDQIPEEAFAHENFEPSYSEPERLPAEPEEVHFSHNQPEFVEPATAVVAEDPIQSSPPKPAVPPPSNRPATFRLGRK